MTSQLVVAVKAMLEGNADQRALGEQLQALQRREDAWQACYDVLNQAREPQGVLIFVAQTLHTKVALDLHQVPRSQRVFLKDQLFDLIKRMLTGPQPVLIQLCLALSALSLQTAEWTGVVDDMIAVLGNEAGIVALYQFFGVFVEEMLHPSRVHVPLTDIHSRVNTEVKAKAPRVLEYILQTVQMVVARGKADLALDVLPLWLKQVPVVHVMESDVFDWAFLGLTQQHTSAAASEVLQTLIEMSGDFNSIPVDQGADRIAKRLLQLDWMECADDNDPQNLELHMRILSAAVDAWHMLIAHAGDHIYPTILAWFIRVLSHETEGWDHIFMTFNGLERLRTALIGPAFNRTDQWIEFGVGLVSAYLVHLAPPKEFDDKESEEDFRELRYDISDMLKIGCDMAGSEPVTQYLRNRLGELLTTHADWRLIEACLFAIRSVARQVSSADSNVVEVMRMLPHVGGNEKVVHSAIMIISRYSTWTSQHPETLEMQMHILYSAMGFQNQKILSACGHAILYLGYDCGQHMAPFLPHLIEKFLPLQIQGETLESMALGIGHIAEATDVTEALRLYGTKVAEDATMVYNYTARTSQDLSAHARELEGFASFIKGLTGPNTTLPVGQWLTHPAVHFVEQYIETFHKLLDIKELVQPTAMLYSAFAAICVGTMPKYMGHLAQPMRLQPSNVAAFHYGTAMCQSLYSLNDAPDSGVVVTTEHKALVLQYADSILPTIFQRINPQDHAVQMESKLQEHCLLYLCDLVDYFYESFRASSLFEPACHFALLSMASTDLDVLLATKSYMAQIENAVQSEGVNGPAGRFVYANAATIVKLMCEGYVEGFYDFEPYANQLLDSVAHIMGADLLPVLDSVVAQATHGSISQEEFHTWHDQIARQISMDGGRHVGSLVSSVMNTFRTRAILPR